MTPARPLPPLHSVRDEHARASLVARLDAEPRSFLRAELIRAHSERQLRAALARAEVIRVAGGIYVGARHAKDFRVRCDAALLWSRGHCVLGGASAAFLHGLTEFAPSRVTLVTPRDVHLRPPPWIDVIQPSVALRPISAAGLRMVGATDALVQSWSHGPREEATALILNAIRDRRVTGAALAACALTYPRICGRRALSLLIASLERGAESYLEHIAMTRVFNTREFACFARQVRVRAGGRSFVLDMYAEEARLAVELDGRRYHGDDATRRRDLARDADLAGIGITTIRLTFEDVTGRREWCRARVRRALKSHRLPPGPRAARGG